MKLARIPYLREAGALIALGLIAWALWAVYDFGYDNGFNKANVRAEKIIGDMARAEAAAQARARKAEQALARGVEQAAESAEERYEQIETEYQRRIDGVVSDRNRLQELWWAERATNRLADGAAAAGEAAEKDRLRRESAARVLRATEYAQAERDEVIDRYQAVHKAFNERND